MNKLSFLLMLLVTDKTLVGEEPQSTYPVAFIESITGPVQIENNKSKGITSLTPNTAKGRILYSDETLLCKAGSARLRVTGPGTGRLLDPVDVCKGVEKWPSRQFETRSVNVPKPLEVLDQTARAGRRKGDESAIFSPPNQCAILPQNLIIRWRTRPPLPKLTVVLLDDQGKELARLPGVDGASGTLDSPGFREALSKYQRTSSEPRQGRLVFEFESVPQQGVTFTLLTPDQEAALTQALKEVSSQAGPFQHVERAAVFDSFRMCDQVAAEYDTAANEAPESRDLIRAALNANARIGNLSRARELRDKLQAFEDASTH